jgi:very-short-patch-repair endonuclease
MARPPTGNQKNSPPYEGGVARAARRGGSLSPISDSLQDDSYPHRKQLNNLEYLKPIRKSLRRSLTPAEASLWKAIKNGKLDGRKFRRQHSVGNYVLDFYCSAEKLAIELDGEVHFQDQAFEADFQRTIYLQSLDIKILRFENRSVFEELDWVLGVIKNNFGWNLNKNQERTTPPLTAAPLLRKEGSFEYDY